MKDVFISEESKLDQHIPAIAQFWSTMHKGYMHVPDVALNCFYAFAQPTDAKYAVFLCQGRIESAHKYQELLWELYQNGFAVFTLDHLGQGESDRLLDNPHIGYINSFDDYVTAVELFFAKFITPKYANKVIVLGHSMGGAIASLFLQNNPNTCLGAFLSAPMFAIHTDGKPIFVVKLIARVMATLGLNKRYALGQSDYDPVSFADNELTHSEIRYNLFRSLYTNRPELQLGGVSYGWLNAALEAMDNIARRPLTLPVTIVSASADTIVDSDAHERIKAIWPQAKVTSIAGAKHELLNESDVYRTQTLNAFYAFCETLIQSTAPN